MSKIFSEQFKKNYGFELNFNLETIEPMDFFELVDILDKTLNLIGTDKTGKKLYLSYVKKKINSNCTFKQKLNHIKITSSLFKYKIKHMNYLSYSSFYDGINSTWNI